MSPNQNFLINTVQMEPVSRTYQYRKIMKPMLERKRRARINKCLDELKELMASTIHNEGESVSKLEKADILELTVRHLQSLREKNMLHSRQDSTKSESFWQGFRQCASEVSQYLSKCNHNVSAELISYINRCTQFEQVRAPTISIRSNAYLYGSYRYEDFLRNKGMDLRQNITYPPPPPLLRTIENNKSSLSVWRPW